MGFKRGLILSCLIGVAAFVGCQRNNENHAPVCPYGQVLAYDQAGYSCHYVSLVPAGFNSLQTQNTSQPGSVLTPPIASCPQGQTLIFWAGQSSCGGSWYCYYTNFIYPSGGNSPQTWVPPSGQGGEYCSSNGYNYAYNSGFGYNPAATCNNFTANLTVGCSPGFQCQPGGQSQGAGMIPGSSYGTMNYGTPGTCVYTGYRGY